MILQVHDELVFEFPHTELEAVSKLVREEMEGVHAIAVPLLVEVCSGPNWRGPGLRVGRAIRADHATFFVFQDS